QHLPGMVLRMGFTGDTDLDRSVLISQDAPEPLHVAEKKRGSFIGRETARKTDRKNIRIQRIGYPALLGGRRFPVDRTGERAFPDELDQVALAPAVRLP